MNKLLMSVVADNQWRSQTFPSVGAEGGAEGLIGGADLADAISHTKQFQ